MSCLLAVTTDLPAFKALRTNSSAVVKPPISSMIMSTSELRIACKSSVQITSLGTQGCFFRSILRLQTCVRRIRPGLRSQRILATARPTVPKPTRATRRAGVLGSVLSAGAATADFEVFLGKVRSHAKNMFPFIIRAARTSVQCKAVCRGGRAALMGEGLCTNLFQQPEQLRRRRSLDYPRERKTPQFRAGI